MKILFATNHLWDYTGSELNLIGLARAMADRGHEVACVAAMVAPRMLRSLRDSGLRVLASADAAVTAFGPDVAFCQHHPAAATVRSRLPQTPIVLAHLGVEPELEHAPLVDCGVSRHLAISEEVRDHLISQDVPAHAITIFRNAVDTASRPARSSVETRKDALLFSYKLSAEARALLADVARAAGMALDADSLTSPGKQSPAEVAARIRTARLVFASGRSALEAAICGAAVVVLGPRGLDGPLTTATWRDLANTNFSGRRHAATLTVEALRHAVDTALRSDVAATGRQLEAEFGLRGRAEQLERLLPMCAAPAMSARELALVRRLAALLHEQRWMAVHQDRLERQSGSRRWWHRLVPLGEH